MTDRELMQQALEMIEDARNGSQRNPPEPVIAALRERLAQPEQKTCLVANESCKHGSWCSEVYCQEHCKFVGQSAQQEQEPVAWMCADDQMVHRGYSRFSRTCAGDWNIPVYTAPRQWQGLTEIEFRMLYVSTPDYKSLWEAIEAKLKEKNG